MKTYEDLHRKLLETRKTSSELSLEHWLYAELNTWQWWLSLGLTILPWVIWWKLCDKKRVFEILGFGLFIIMIAVFIDVAGSELVLWNYPRRLLPIVPRLWPFDFTIAPVTFMLLYQYFPKWKSFLIASALISGVLAFIAEPLLVLLKLYELITWKYIYSFPVYFGAAVISKGIVGFIQKKSTK